MDSAWKKRDLFSGRLDGVVMLTTLFPSVAGFTSLHFFRAWAKRGKSQSCQFSCPLTKSALIPVNLSSTLIVIPLTLSIFPSVSSDWTLNCSVCKRNSLYLGRRLSRWGVKECYWHRCNNFARFSIFFFDYVFCFFISPCIKRQSIDVYPGFRLQ